jgi:hypothetical protein
MATPQEYLEQIERIVGDDLSDGEINLRLTWNDYTEGKAHIDNIRAMQRHLRQLKKEVTAEVSGLKSHFIGQKASVGTSIGAGLAGLFLGRRTVGRFNAANREDLRRAQIQSVAPYEDVKRTIDQILHFLDGCKSQIERSAEYQNRSRQQPRPRPTAAPPAPATDPLRIFAHIGDQVKGPYTADQLIALHDAGALANESLVWIEGSQEWFPLGNLPTRLPEHFAHQTELQGFDAHPTD